MTRVEYESWGKTDIPLSASPAQSQVEKPNPPCRIIVLFISLWSQIGFEMRLWIYKKWAMRWCTHSQAWVISNRNCVEKVQLCQCVVWALGLLHKRPLLFRWCCELACGGVWLLHWRDSLPRVSLRQILEQWPVTLQHMANMLPLCAADTVRYTTLGQWLQLQYDSCWGSTSSWDDITRQWITKDEASGLIKLTRSSFVSVKGRNH